MVPICIRGPCRPPQRAAGACRPLGGRQAPLFFFSRDFVANLKKKNYTLGLSPYGRATGVYFWNFPKRTYIFEFFFKYKKRKTRCYGSLHGQISLYNPPGTCSVQSANLTINQRTLLFLSCRLCTSAFACCCCALKFTHPQKKTENIY